MTTATLVPVSGNGVATTTVRDALLCLDKHELVVVIGRHVVLQHLQSHELAFVTSGSTCGELTGEITALAVCPKRRLLAVCRAASSDGRQRKDNASVTIYGIVHHPPADKSMESKSSTDASTTLTHWAPRGVLHKTLGFDTDKFASVAFSHDGKLVCCQACNDDWTLLIWDWGRARQVASVDVHTKVSRVRFNSVDMAQISTSGGHVLRIWTLCEYTLKVFASFTCHGDEDRVASSHSMAKSDRHHHPRSATQYVDHVWLPNDCLVALLENGDVQLVVNTELVQTIPALHGSSRKLSSMSALINGEGVLVGGDHGLISVLRIAAKLMKASEMEMHLERRVRVQGGKQIRSLTTNLEATTVFCCTEAIYGTYDLSNLCLLRDDDELISLAPLSSTPISVSMDTISASSRRPVIAACCELANGDQTINIWNQMDCHECVVTHVLDQGAPLSVDMHASGLELAVALSTKIQIYYVLQDSLRLGFELAHKQMSIVQYSASGALLAALHSSNKEVYIYTSFTRSQREPQLLGVYHDFHDVLSRFTWAPHDLSCFVVDASGELRHLRLQTRNGGDVEDFVGLQSQRQGRVKGNAITSLLTCKLDAESHNYVLFTVESSVQADRKKCSMRAWINGNLKQTALADAETHKLSMLLNDQEITALAPGPGKLLFLGTESGSIVAFRWKVSMGASSTSRMVTLSPVASLRADMHLAPVVGLHYSNIGRCLISNASNGTMLAYAIRSSADHESTVASDTSVASLLVRERDALADISVPSNSSLVSSIAQCGEVALYDRNAFELRKLKIMDLESELQQLKMENELLNRQISEQRQQFQLTMQQEIASFAERSEEQQQTLLIERETQFRSELHERESSLHTLSNNARLAQDQYLHSVDRLQRENAKLREQLEDAQAQIEDLTLSTEETITDTQTRWQQQLSAKTSAFETLQTKLQDELTLTKRQLQEVLRQQDQDLVTQMGMLHSALESEKARSAEQLNHVNGKLAALHQEVKMLLGALMQKDHELETRREEDELKSEQVQQLHAQLQDETRSLERMRKEKQDALASLMEQKHVNENLTRLNTVHRSQIEMLQKHLIPKDRELDQMQQYLGHLHEANQDIVIQANCSDRLRAEAIAKAKKVESDVQASQRQLEKIRHSIVVVHEELSELVKKSAVHEKTVLVGEIIRIHKRLSRQLDVLQARNESADEISAELHRQNSFLLKNKQYMRRQIESANHEKHKLVSALSYQNATLVAELNTLKKQKKELERSMKRIEEERQHCSTKRGIVTPRLAPSASTPSIGTDGRKIFAEEVPETTVTESSLSASNPEPITQRGPPLRARMARPQSATACPSRRSVR